MAKSNNSMLKWVIAAGAVIVVIALAAWAAGGSSGGDAGSVTVIGNEELRDLVADGARLADIRTPGEYEAGHIEGAQLVPPAEVTNAADGWDSGDKVVVYCATGARSAAAAQTLAGMGFEVYDLTAGLAAWDGDLVSGGDSSSSGGSADLVATSGIPVMYEFLTDT